MRRANSTGTVYKQKNRRKPWVAYITLGWDEEGKQIRKYLGSFLTKADAEMAISKERLMPTADNANITLSDLWEQWKTTRAYTELSRQTQGSYNAAFNYMDKYHKTKFRDLRLPHFQDMVDKAYEIGKSSSTMKKINTLCGILSGYAKDQDIINKVYSDNVRVPKTEKKKIETFSDLEVDRLFRNDSIPIVDTILILIYTGMRITELLTLTKFNVDLDKMLIVGGIKTESGYRVIPIHPKIQKYVRLRYEQSSNYLIERPDGKKYRYEHYHDVYNEALDKLGIDRKKTPHKARHTFFTMLTARSKDRKANAMLGGHTDPNFTDKVYVQPDIERLRKAIESL